MEDAGNTIKQMIQFIEQEAKEKARDIIEKVKQEYQIELEKMIASSKEKIKAGFEDKLEKYAIQKRIETSALTNQTRIKKMSSRNEYIDKLLEETKKHLQEYFQGNKEEYKKLLHQVMVQGLVKLMEEDVFIRCRKSDTKLIESLIPSAVKEYQKLIVTEVPRFKGKEIKCNLNIHPKAFLPEYNDPATSLPSSCGGVDLVAHNNKIICGNTIDIRLELVFQESLPSIRTVLFPSLAN